MEKNINKLPVLKKLGWVGIGLCGLCCALPLVGGVMALSSLTAIAYYLEKISILVIGLIGIAFFYAIFKKKQTSKIRSCSCDTNCKCKNENIS